MLDSCYGSAAERLRRLLYCSNQPPARHYTIETLSRSNSEPLSRVHDGWYTSHIPGLTSRCIKYQRDVKTSTNSFAGSRGDLYRTEVSTLHPRGPIIELATKQQPSGVLDVTSLKDLHPKEDILLALFNHSHELDDYCEALKDENDVLQEEVKTLRKALEQLQEARRSKLNGNLDMLERLVETIEECKLSKNDSVKLDTKLQQHSASSRIEMIQLHGRLRQSSNDTKQLQERERIARAQVHEAVLVATEAKLQVEQYANKVKELERELERERQHSEHQSDSF